MIIIIHNIMLVKQTTSLISMPRHICSFSIFLVLLAIRSGSVYSFPVLHHSAATNHQQKIQPSSLFSISTDNFIEDGNSKDQNNHRRAFLVKSLTAGAAVFTSSLPPANAVERAVGSSEMACRKEGNCLQKFDLDGAVGWNWGAKDRCDATDPRCKTDGKLSDEPLSGQAVPKLIDNNGNPLKITNIIDVDISIGRAEKGTLRIGLYGETCPNSVAQLLDIFGGGLLTTSKIMLEDGLGVETTPVSLLKGGNLQVIYPETKLDFGIASQAIGYAKMKGLSKAPESFLPQPRPNKEGIMEENSARSHDAAGLLSIAKSGLGYGGSGLESEDEAFASSFQIISTSVPNMDKDSRKVVGQLVDDDSMQFLQRLTSLPTIKGLKGVLPGQNAGPPLIKVSITSVSSSKND